MYDEIIYRVRKDGSMFVGSMAKAHRVIEAARQQGYTLGRRCATFGGVILIDLDD